jgi:hypothetical protein
MLATGGVDELGTHTQKAPSYRMYKLHLTGIAHCLVDGKDRLCFEFGRPLRSIMA